MSLWLLMGRPITQAFDGRIPADTAPTPFARWMLILPLLFLALRSAFAPFVELFADEAYYWDWSRTLALGYLDHPPLVAWLIRASTTLFGTHEFTVRLPAILLATSSIVVATEIARQLGAPARTLLLLQSVLICFPMLHVQGTIITPDVPAMAFVLAALLAAVHAQRNAGFMPWLVLGVLSGLAMLSKYTALVPIAALLIYLLAYRPSAWPRVLLAGLVASAVVSPMLAWNAANDWVSIRFQLAHGTSPDQRGALLNLGDYIGGQLIVATPLLAVLMLYTAAVAWRWLPALRVLIVPAAATLLFFAFTALRHKVEANWPSQAWLPLVVVLAMSWPAFRSSVQRLARWSVGLAAFAVLVLMMPPSLLTQINQHAPQSKSGGWRTLIQRIGKDAGDRQIVCMKYQDAAMFAFYLPGRPVVPMLSASRRPAHYDYVPLPELTGEFVLIGSARLEPGVLNLVHGERGVRVEVIEPRFQYIDLDGIQTRGRYYAICRLAARDVRD